MRPARVAGAALAGLSATLLMEYASGWMYEREDTPARAREERLRPEMPTTALVRKSATLLGHELANERAERLGMVSHYTFGAAGGLIATLLTAVGFPPVKAGLAVAIAMSVIVDEGLNTVLGLTPPPREFPWQAHARGAAAHAVYGAALGLLLAAADDTSDANPRWRTAWRS